MVAIYIYNTATGTLVSWCPNDTDPTAPSSALTAQGLTSVSGLPPLGPTIAWSSSSHTTITIAAPTPANVINTFDFIMAFTPAELATIRGSSINSIQQFLFAMQVTQGVNLNSSSIQNALNFLVGQTLLTAPRAAAILATVGGNAASG